MSSASDISAFEHSVEPAPAETLFRDKNGHTFRIPPLTLVNTPVKFNSTSRRSPRKLHFVQVVIDGTTVQTNQVHENVNTTFKAITEMDYNTYVKHGPTSNFALDEYSAPAAGTSLTQNFDNVTTSSFINATVGEFGMSNTLLNKGAYERSLFTALYQQANKLAYDVMGSSANIQAVSKPQLYVAAPVPSLLLRDICDYFKKCPMQKNTRGFIYLNYNNSSTTITASSTGMIAPGTITVSNNMNFGNTCPILWNFYSAVSTATLTPTGLAVPSGTVLTVTADVNGTPTTGTGITPSQSFSRLLVPTYSPNPSADHALAQTKTFRYFERITNKFTVAPGQSFTWTISNGIANPKRLIMQPVITNPTAGGTVSDTINPFRNPFSTVPATTSPFATLKNLQVTVGNVSIWNNPVSFGYDLFLQEMSKSGVDGGLDDLTSAGLLPQRQWESLYRFVAVDIGRRLPSEDGASKSIIASGTSNCNYALTIYYHVLREVAATVDTAMGTISQGPTKQKAYDRYYNAMEKSDFVQGKKLKALIQHESLDDASTDSLAKLFQQVMSKNREYEYDEITKKLLKGPKGPPEIIKGEISETPKSSKKKYKYVPTSTDTDANMEDPTAPKDEAEDITEAFYRGVNDVAQKAVNTRAFVKGRKSLKEVVDDHVMKYLDKQKEFRKEDSNRRHRAMANKFAAKVMEKSAKLLKRKLPNKSPTDKRATKKRLSELRRNPRLLDNYFKIRMMRRAVTRAECWYKKVYTDDINSYNSSYANNLYESIRQQFGEPIELRKGKDYFADYAPQPPRKHKMSKIAMKQYKEELKGWFDGIFI
ncbi:hypothetical protein PHPALM_31502 [Phytophthora palmivora]|uniref:Uncharacterized protein n=1 Tax=Phytophthora palmivora TaxID=4796 RepID=A0A2P4X2E6_9STRA|nr:hypothetical protein PHPALM_31502 [Phytophthora palmivora]